MTVILYCDCDIILIIVMLSVWDIKYCNFVTLQSYETKNYADVEFCVLIVVGGMGAGYSSNFVF